MADINATPTQADHAERLAQLWDSGSAPDLDLFLAAHPNLVADDLAALAHVDQSRRWERGDRTVTEHYFSRFPAIKDDPTAAVDLIHHEFILRESLGPPPTVDEFTSRFPEYATTIRDQVAIHLALATGIHPRDDHLAVGREVSRPGIAETLSPTAALTQFGRYVLLERIGQGGMGTVFRAHDDQLDRQVALKILRVGPDPDGHFASRFLREARIAANFTDPRLCPVYDAGILNGVHYFTMPLIAGETLAIRVARDGAVHPDVAARLVAMIARGVSIAHRAGVVHRDLKPANVMVTSAGTPVILDFGLARQHTAFDSVSTERGVVLGTPGYMAPEQIGGDSRSVGPAADVYSLGVILYQLLTGRLPFDGPPHELMREALTQNPVPPRQIRPELEPAIEAISLRAMARDIADRIPSMDAFADSLESYLDRPSAAAARPRRRKRRFVLAGLLALCALIGLVSIGLSIFFGRSPSATSRATPAAHFPVGAVWSGRFVFRGRLSGYEGDVTVKVIESRGRTFLASYNTEGGKFEWQVSGNESNDHVHWEFVRATRGNVYPSIVGQAHVSGHYRNGVLDLVFTDGDSSADVVLTRSR